jgi:hypothetical protein
MKIKGAMHKKVSAAVAGERRKLELRGKTKKGSAEKKESKEQSSPPRVCG